VRPAVLIAVAAALIVFAWLELQTSAGPVTDLIEILALALAPAIALALTGRWWVGAIVFVLALAPAAGLAFAVPVSDMRLGRHDYFGPVFDAIGDGLRDIYETDAPYARSDHPELAGLVLLAVFVLVGLTAMLITCRRYLWAGLVLVVGVGVPVTISASYGIGSPVRTGALVLAAILFTLFLTRGDRPLRGLAQAAILGAVLVLVAVGASTTDAIAKPSFLKWQRWDLYDRPKDPVGVRYVWTSNYRGITFPKKETIVLRIKAPPRSQYWRATTLDDYTGVGWRESLDPGPPVTTQQFTGAAADPLLPPAARQPKNWIRQDVTVVALSDTHLVAASQPVKWAPRGQGPVQYSNGIVLAPRGLTIGSQYTVWSYAPQIKPTELAKLPADYPDELDRYLEVVPDVVFPEFGAKDRAETVDALFQQRDFDTLLAEYEPLYRQAQKVVEKTTSPYLAAASLETWFRSGGGFTYAEQPEQPVDATPPLVDFVLRSKEGYCQHYAGAMAVMLRLLGIPARVAVGFTSGDYDSRRKEWVVTDYNAHAWVEVYFPEHGWLPFDPTPGRGELGQAYSTGSNTFPSGGPTALGVAPDALSAILRQRLKGTTPGGLRAEDTGVGPGTVAGDDGGISVVGLVFLILGSALALLLVAKALRREARFLSRDPRRVAGACRRDLVAFLSDQRVVFPESATVSELGAWIEQSFRVNATPFVRAVNTARFGAPGEAAEAAARGRRELKTLRRQLRRELSATSRARGALSLRSLTV
jgi:transglutaminase-like putative cysteine protease